MGTKSAALLLAASAVLAQERFQSAGSCALCHARIAPPKNAVSAPAAIGPNALWAGSMKAQAARDPFWKAKVAAEIAATPAAAELIEAKCFRCHAPMQQYGAGRVGLAKLDLMGGEGVSCTVCHQITDKALGSPESFTGGFTIGAGKEIYGPHAEPFSHPMEMHTGYTPVQAKHVTRSELCATCHTVITPAMDAQGRARGELVEQAPYLEWRASSHAREGRTCQSCHMPMLKDGSGKQIPQHIAHTPGGFPFPPTEPRAPFAMHQFVGANAPMLRLLATLYPDRGGRLLESAARSEALLKSAAELHVSARRDGDDIDVTVDVINRAGHKLPTGFPSRRMWLTLRAGDAAPVVARVWETTMLDTEGRPTTTLLRAARYARDNRILPAGWRDPDPRIVPVAAGDGMAPGRDRVRMRLSGPGPVIAELWYESVKAEYAAIDAALGGLKPVLMARAE